jgi:membrane-associated phospholipid phosphatase
MLSARVSPDKVKKRTVEVVRYCALYVLCFCIVEHRQVRPYIIHTSWDDLIPFCEYFIIPYLLWFVFVMGCVLWFGAFQSSEREYRSLTRNLAFGCTLFLLISAVFPNGQDLRPVLAGDNVFQQLVMQLYQRDTATNVFPSIHVFNSVACCTAVLRNHRLRSSKLISGATVVLTVSIILATVFLKQHTVVDVCGALVLNAFTDRMFYQKAGTEMAAPAWNRRLGVAQGYSARNFRS